MCFPPSFFDIMPHLMMHMVDQIQQLSPVYLHQMWMYEQFMSTLNRYVLNRAHPEGSMIEAYTTEEVVNCCTRYIKDRRVIGLPVHPHEGRTSGMGCTGRKVDTDIPNAMIQEAYYNICHHLVVMETYVEKHMEELHAAHDGQRTEAWVKKSTRELLHIVTSRPGARLRPTLPRSGPTCVATHLSFRPRFAQNG
jgi:hypothetical protein